MFKHISKFLSLWFAKCHQQDYAEIMVNVIDKTIHQIPSFHFVPLPQQLWTSVL